MNTYGRMADGGLIFDPDPEDPTWEDVQERAARLRASLRRHNRPGHRAAVRIFGEAYEHRFPVLAGPGLEGGAPDGIR